ncbi:MAG: beta-Ala-His dipeptidase [Oscillospiraceae bacterium]|jgi:dipeptidase D|nr:beta-Ala-His dipeptidase [Oscillospiraceae bacterium]
MQYILTNVEPKAPLRYFEDISAIPRGSHDEKAVSQYLLDFAKEHGLTAKRDELWNVLITKPGQHGGESAPPLALQGHTDMVCEKEADSAHDFSRDPLKLILENGRLRAGGTTLGADNGTAVVIMLALLADKDLPHPPLECLFTSQEETGLGGAAAIDPEWITARRMINMDCGPEGEVTVGCSGGLRTLVTRNYTPVPVKGQAYAIRLMGLTGGHSGGLIHRFQANANKLLGRAYAELRKIGVGLVSIRGGAKDNAIPHEGLLVVSVTPDIESRFLAAVDSLRERFQEEYKETDPGLTLDVSKTDAASQLDEESAEAVMNIILFHPNGVKHISEKLDIVVTSLNLGVVTTEDSAVTMSAAVRSSTQSQKQALANKIERLSKLCGAQYSQGNSYPGWAYDETSALRDRAQRVYEGLTGKRMIERATHGGLECGLFKGKWPELDVIAIGCDTTGIHSPKESLDLASFARVYEFVRALAADLARG